MESKTNKGGSMVVKTLNAGNLAIEAQVFTIGISEAKRIRKYMQSEMGVRAGSYWHSNFIRPVNAASRAGRDVVTVSSAGFGASELFQIAAVCGVGVVHV